MEGEKRQDGALADMVFGPAFLLAYVSQHMTLVPGDLIATGTPAGVGRLEHGQRVEVRLVGADGTVRLSLSNPVIRRSITPSPSGA